MEVGLGSSDRRRRHVEANMNRPAVGHRSTRLKSTGPEVGGRDSGESILAILNLFVLSWWRPSAGVKSTGLGSRSAPAISSLISARKVSLGGSLLEHLEEVARAAVRLVFEFLGPEAGVLS